MHTRLTPIAAALLLALQTPAQAAGSTDADGVYDRYLEQDAGLGYGVLIGGLIAGPAGAFVGGAAGTLIGHTLGTGRELDETRAQLAASTSAPPAPSAAHCGHYQTVALSEDPLQGILEQGFGVSLMFRTGTDVLEASYIRQLDELARVVARVPDLQVDIRGHADARGSSAANLELSERRIIAVETVLIAAGIPADQIEEHPLGEAEARAVAGDVDGQALERRVVVRFSRRQPLLEAAR